MSRLDRLRHLAGLVGITLRHVDALGVWHEPGEEALSRLIAALGLPEDAGAAAQALAAEGATAPFGLPALHIVAAEDPQPVLPLPPDDQLKTSGCAGSRDGTERRGRH